MAEMAGGLIEMNVHMVRTADSRGMMIWGALIGCTCILFALLSLKDCGWGFSTILAAIGVAGLILLIVGAKMPRVKEIRACAQGPVSIEQIAVVYDIVDVDGKELTLRER